VELHAGAGGLRRDRVGRRAQPLDAADVQADVLAAGVDDLLVEREVSLVAGQVGQHEVPRGQRGEDADQHDRGVGLHRAVLGAREAGPDVLLVAREAGVLDQPRARVELEVELAELGLECRVGEVGQDLRVAHRRLGLAVDQVELDLEPGRRPLGVEPEVVEHQREDVKATPDLLPISDTLLAREPDRRHILAHACPPRRTGPV
jgi:hypothetical protein